jgi:REP element-mobilizing transposase RayT
MSQSLSKIWTHLVFSTKERFPFLSDETVRHDMHSYLAKVLKENNCPTLVVGGVSDHVHLLFVLSKNHSIRQHCLVHQTPVLEVGKGSRSDAQKVSLARWLWRILCESVAC